MWTLCRISAGVNALTDMVIKLTPLIFSYKLALYLGFLMMVFVSKYENQYGGQWNIMKTKKIIKMFLTYKQSYRINSLSFQPLASVSDNIYVFLIFWSYIRGTFISNLHIVPRITLTGLHSSTQRPYKSDIFLLKANKPVSNCPTNIS